MTSETTGSCVMVVDDDRDICQTLEMVLEVHGYRVITAGNGKDALTKLRSGDRPCLILLDLMMPVMNGSEFRAEQRQDPALASIPVVVLSGDSRAADKARSLDVEGLSKPVDIDDLVALVERFCGRPAGAD